MEHAARRTDRPSRSVSSRGSVLALLAVVALSACAPLSPPALQSPPALLPPSVGIYGDSISYQASPWSDAAVQAAGMRVIGARFPGLAACDLIEPVRRDLVRPVSERPTVIVVSTVGNSLTPCMRNPDGTFPIGGTPEFSAAYERSLVQIADAAAAADVPFIFTWGPTSSPFLAGWEGDDHLGLVAARVAETRPGMTLAHVGSVVLDADDRYQVSLPCRPDEVSTAECREGQVRIRVSATDLHFHCAATQLLPGGWPRPCPVESPGARRYGLELARVALERIDAPGARVSG